MNEGSDQKREKQFDHKETVLLEGSSSFWPKINLHRILFFSLQQGLDAVRSHCSQGDWSKIACFHHRPPPRLSPPQSKWGPDRNQQRRFTPHESVIHQHRHATGSHAASEIAFYTLHKKEPVVIKYQKLITWLQNDSQIYIMIMSKNYHNIKKFLVMLVTHNIGTFITDWFWDH